MTGDVVIVGAGQAGLQAALSLRDEGFAGRIRLIGDEAGLPYQRPPLSKAFLTGDATEANLELRAAAFLGHAKIEIVSGTRVDGIDRADGRVRLGSGESVAYDHLILATGSRNRRLDIDGASAAGVVSLRTLEDARHLKARLADAQNIVVIGAGFIGLEFAAVAAKLGRRVHVVEFAPRVMARAISETSSAYFRAKHEGWGTRFTFGAGAEAIEQRGGRVTGVRLDDGTLIAADLVVVGIGAVANVELAVDADLATGNGIVVDAHLKTTDAAISAIGDCAFHPNGFAGGPIRLESVQNAIDQARTVAARLTGKAKPYHAVPWFWSDQGDAKLQMAGLTAGHDHVVERGDRSSGRFSVFCFRSGLFVGVESVNRPADNMLARRVLTANRPWTQGDVEAFDYDLKAMTAEPGRDPAAA